MPNLFSTDCLLAAVLLLGLLCYTLTAGADFGAGIWTLLAAGPRRARQQQFIADTIAPIWEANHVWLIFVVVVLFTAFPAGFSEIMTSLIVPFVVLLGAIVLRGTTFIFARYDPEPRPIDRLWRVVFGLSSLTAPCCLGVIVAALVTGRASSQYGFIHSWFTPFGAVLGMMTTVLFAHLASVYLAREAAVRDTAGPAIAADFRHRAIMTSAIMGLVAAAAVWAAHDAAPRVAQAAWPLLLVGGVLAAIRATALLRGHVSAARLLVGAEVPLIFAGWAWAQYPWLIYGRLSFAQAAAPAATRAALLWTLVAGGVLIVPAFLLLYSVFDGRRRTARQPVLPTAPPSERPTPPWIAPQVEELL